MTDKNNKNTDPKPASTSELLELAAIDALGLLDDEDRAAFDAGFQRAPATLKDLIRDEQARIADCGELLPGVDPTESLRERTLARIRGEIDRRHASPAPAKGRVASHQPTPRPPRLQRARRVNPAWRISAVAAAVAVVVLGVLHVQLRSEFNTVRDGAQISALIDAIGVEHIEATLFDASSQRFQFKPVADVGRGRAMLWHNPDSNEARLYIATFPEQASYKLVVVDQNNKPIKEIATFMADGLLKGINVHINQTGTMRLAIMTDDTIPQMLFVAEVKLA